MRENVNKDVCKDLPIRNFSPAKKAEDIPWTSSGTKFEKQSKGGENKN